MTRAAVPKAWPVAVKPALTCPAATVTLAGSVTMPVGEAASVMTVALLCAEEIVTVKVCDAPGLRLAVAGCMATTVGGAGVTVIWLEALLPFRLAVMWAVPAPTAVSVAWALSCPAGMLRVAGVCTTLGASLARLIVVALLWADEMVTVTWPVAPWVRFKLAGAMLAIVGGIGVTCTVLCALAPFRLTVMTVLAVVLPAAATPWTGTATAV